MPILLLCELIRNCKILRITIQLQPHGFDFPFKNASYKLFAPTASQLLAHVKRSLHVMPNRVPTILHHGRRAGEEKKKPKYERTAVKQLIYI